jgi:hypothetical protein
MNREDLLFEYFEGALSETQEEVLFDQLQNDIGLREDFNQQMKILMLTKQDSPGIKTPFDSTNAIFNSLGIKSNHYYSLRRKEKFADFMKSTKFRRTLYLSVILFFTFFSSFFVYNTLEDSLGFGSNNPKNSGIPIVSNFSGDNNRNDNIDGEINSISGTRSFSYLQILAGQIIQTQELIKGLKSQLNAENKTKLKRKELELANLQEKFNQLLNSGKVDEFANINQNTTEINDREIGLITQTTLNFASNDDFGKSKFLEYQNLNRRNLNFQRYSDKMQNPFSNDVFAQFYNKKNSKLEISFRSNSPSYTIPEISSTQIETSKTNFELGVGYKLNNTNQIGFIVGRDNFPQSFNHSIDGSNYRLIQNPQLTYYGIGYKYIPDNILYQDTFLPYVFAMLSGTAVGPYLKAQTGIELNLFSQISLFAGIENGTLIYNVDNIIYSTNKVNFVYGMNIKF